MNEFIGNISCAVARVRNNLVTCYMSNIINISDITTQMCRIILHIVPFMSRKVNIIDLAKNLYLHETKRFLNTYFGPPILIVFPHIRNQLTKVI